MERIRGETAGAAGFPFSPSPTVMVPRPPVLPSRQRCRGFGGISCQAMQSPIVVAKRWMLAQCPTSFFQLDGSRGVLASRPAERQGPWGAPPAEAACPQKGMSASQAGSTGTGGWAT
jgi:hypothetical protein